MIPYDIDPSLHSSEPQAEHLGDGFSPPAAHGESAESVHPADRALEPSLLLGDKSDF